MSKVIVKLMGGLGNQMFQFSAGHKIAKKLNYKLIFDTNFLDDRTTDVVHRNFDLSIFKNVKNDVDNSPGQHIDKFIINDSNRHVINSDNLDFIKSDVYLDGFFQSYDLIDESMINIFSFDEYENVDCNRIHEEAKLQNSLMINVRRGDYVSRPSARSFHGVLEMKYFEKAKASLSIKIDKIFVFSDDTEWCANNFVSWNNTTVVGHEFAGQKFKDYLQLMSKFPNMIIPNSTFAWWAAWIAEKSGTLKKVAAPGASLWFAGNPGKSSGLIPNNWITLEKKDLMT